MFEGAWALSYSCENGGSDLRSTKEDSSIVNFSTEAIDSPS